jgi:hypothetical protein
MTEKGDERRRAERYAVYASAELVTEKGDVAVALTEDVSASGVLLLTRARLDVGQTVQIRIHVQGHPPRMVSGRVARSAKLPPGASPLWTEEVAVVVEGLTPEIADALKAVGARQSARPGPADT